MKTRVAVVDDNSFLIHALIEKLSFFPELEIKMTAQDGHELLELLADNSTIDIIMMDIEMPGMDGIEATFAVKQKFPHIKIVMLTVFDNDEHIFKAIQAGANGYLLKETPPEDLHRGIVETLDGGAAMSPSIASKTLRLLRDPLMTREFTKPEQEIKLTSREVEILEHLSTGLSYDAIASNLNISYGTVRKHIENTYKKLQVHNKLEAVQKARKQRLI